MNNNITDAFEKYLSHTVSALFSLQAGEEFEKAVLAISSCQGTVITTGMGKAGHAARKISSSLSSLGIPSSYVHPGEAAHGDIGLVKNGDVVMAFSTSGKTREVLETIRFAKDLGATHIIAITAHPSSPIREASDIVLDMGDHAEAGDLGLAPTTSIILMLVLADFVVLEASRAKGFKQEDFAKRHHGGYLGQKSRGEII